MSSLNRTFVITTLLLTTLTAGCGGSAGGSSLDSPAQDTEYTAGSEVTAGATDFTETLNTEETEGLLLMREEEKLARDVYSALYDIHGLPIFANISASEQVHTDAIKDLLLAYGIDDPVEIDIEGLFENTTLQQLYESLTASGEATVLDALYVGATVEELDTYDLEHLMSQLDGNDDIRLVYENLLKGSRNHLRAFDAQISLYGGSYSPSYISEEEYDAIVSSPQETDPIQ